MSLFSKDSKSKKNKKSEVSEPLLSTVPFLDSVDASEVTITLSSIQSAAGGYDCILKNTGKKDINISRFCISNFANAIRNTGVGRNFYGIIKAGKSKKFNISYVGHELANRDPVLFNFLLHSNSIALILDENKKPYRIDNVIRS
jgi:hypothetical protein